MPEKGGNNEQKKKKNLFLCEYARNMLKRELFEINREQYFRGRYITGIIMSGPVVDILPVLS